MSLESPDKSTEGKENMSEKLDPGKLTPETLALLLTNAGQRLITAEQVRYIAEQGNLLSVDDTINLIQYTAFLAQEANEGKPNE
ncbi:MAG TPA: hypothetical protein DEB39_07215 [Planctomycetaceae bacterium]|nr:hypothetical protein [Planctomycetaceae bacterium]